MDNNTFEKLNTEGAEKTAPWFLQKDNAQIPKDYNPYREKSTVLSDSLAESRHKLKGPHKLEGEQQQDYEYRMALECVTLKAGVYKRLRGTSVYVALILFVLLMMTFFSSLALSEISGLLTEDAYSILNYVFISAQYVILFPPAIYIATLGRKNKVRTYFKKPEVSAFYIARWSVIALGAVYVSSLVSNVIFSLIESAGVYVSDLSAPLPSTPLELTLYFIGVVILAPLFEEILFRGVLLTSTMKYGIWFSALCTGFLFGAYHQNHQQMLYAMIFGILLAFIDVKAGSIIPSIIAHIGVNLFAFISTLTLSFTNYTDTVADPSLKLDGPTFALFVNSLLDILVYALMITAVIAFIIEVVFDRKQFSFKENHCGLTPGEKISAFFASPAMIGLLLIIAFFIMLNSFIDYEALADALAGKQ
jgi:membrane protease YdiL (CAAX protease family)